MSDTEAPRRAKRQCARSSRFASAAVPSAVHYVGYVEDDETPEMIMAKFSELEKIKLAQKEGKKAEAAADGDQPQGEKGAADEESEPSQEEDGLSDEQLLEVFKQTSMFSVKTALLDNEMLMNIDEILDHTTDRYGPVYVST
jgi:hypothetical protein